MMYITDKGYMSSVGIMGRSEKETDTYNSLTYGKDFEYVPVLRMVKKMAPRPPPPPHLHQKQDGELMGSSRNKWHNQDKGNGNTM